MRGFGANLLETSAQSRRGQGRKTEEEDRRVGQRRRTEEEDRGGEEWPSWGESGGSSGTSTSQLSVRKAVEGARAAARPWWPGGATQGGLLDSLLSIQVTSEHVVRLVQLPAQLGTAAHARVARHSAGCLILSHTVYTLYDAHEFITLN